MDSNAQKAAILRFDGGSLIVQAGSSRTSFTNNFNTRSARLPGENVLGPSTAVSINSLARGSTASAQEWDGKREARSERMIRFRTDAELFACTPMQGSGGDPNRTRRSRDPSALPEKNCPAPVGQYMSWPLGWLWRSISPPVESSMLTPWTQMGPASFSHRAMVSADSVRMDIRFCPCGDMGLAFADVSLARTHRQGHFWISDRYSRTCPAIGSGRTALVVGRRYSATRN